MFLKKQAPYLYSLSMISTFRQSSSVLLWMTPGCTCNAILTMCVSPMRAALLRSWLCRRTGRSELGVWCQRFGAYARRTSLLEPTKVGGRGRRRRQRARRAKTASQLRRARLRSRVVLGLPEGYVAAPVQSMSRMCRRELTPRVPILPSAAPRMDGDPMASEIGTALPLLGLPANSCHTPDRTAGVCRSGRFGADGVCGSPVGGARGGTPAAEGAGLPRRRDGRSEGFFGGAWSAPGGGAGELMLRRSGTARAWHPRLAGDICTLAPCLNHCCHARQVLSSQDRRVVLHVMSRVPSIETG